VAGCTGDTTLWTVAAQWTGVTVALLLGIVSVFMRTVQGWFYYPDFEVTTECRPPHCVQVPKVRLDTGDRALSIYLRVWVRNVGNETARNVEVYTESLTRRRADGGWERVADFPPMDLVWSNFFGGMYLPLIGAGVGKHCDIGYIVEPGKRRAFGEENLRLGLNEDQVSLTFDLIAKPNNSTHIVRPGTYRLGITITAENTRRPVRRQLEIDVRGQWYDDEERMLSDGVGIRML
jgi:hypothetical protein